MKLLLWSAVLLIIVLWLFRTKKISGGMGASASGQAARSSGIEQIVQCVHCGVHVPASEVVRSPSGAVFCSQEHRIKHVDS